MGPQVAEKLDIPQITYAEEIVSADDKKIRVKRRLERGVETVECQYPVLVTVNGSAAPCRPRNAKRLMKYKKATGKSERANNEALEKLVAAKPYLDINEWTVNDIECDVNQLGLAGSPTKVKQIENIVFQAKEAKVLGNSDAEIDDLMKELIANHTIG